MAWEDWNTHSERIKAEREALTPQQCNVEVNEWAAYDHYRSEKHKICARPVHVEAAHEGVQMCGLHLRQHRKQQAEKAKRLAEHHAAQEQHKINKQVNEIQEQQVTAIREALVAAGFDKKDVNVNTYRWGRHAGEVTIEVGMHTLFQLLNLAPMQTPKEKSDAWLASLEAAKKQDEGPAPF